MTELCKQDASQRARRELVAVGRLRVDNDFYFPAGEFPVLDEAPYVEIIKKRDAGQ